jgi:hypothetical protein
LAWFAALRSLIEARHRRSDVGRGGGLRRLAAIGAADVPSYLRLKGADREGTLARLGRLRLDPMIALRKGRTLKPTGAVEPMLSAAG